MYGYTKMKTSDVEVEVKAEAEVKSQGQIKLKDVEQVEQTEEHILIK